VITQQKRTQLEPLGPVNIQKKFYI
jgi:hypothetical protein